MMSELRPSGTGYVGDLPKNWTIVPMGKACTKVTDGTHATPETIGEGRPYITAIHVKNGRIDFDSCLFLSEEDHRETYNRCNPVCGDLAVVNIGAGVGECGYVNVDFEFSMKNVALLKPDEAIVSPLYLLNSHLFRRERIAHVVKSGGAQPFLSLRDLRKLPILLPPLPEQRKIAEILSVWDRAIEVSEALLATARRQKHALMQTLLTGKTRFPEFVGQEWKSVQMDSLGATFTGLTGKTKGDFGEGFPFITYMNIFKNSQTSVTDFGYVFVGPNERQNRVKFGDLFFTTSSETPHEVGMSSVFLDDVSNLFLNSFCFGFRLHNFDTIRPEFARFLFRGQVFRKMLNRLAQGATRYNLSKTNFLKLEFQLPSVEEQDQISAVLEIAQDEEDGLVVQLAHLRTEKRALMQQLLTGKRRVKP